MAFPSAFRVADLGAALAPLVLTGTSPPAPAASDYPPGLVELVGGRRPFTPGRPDGALALPIEELADREGTPTGRVARIAIEGHGKRRMLVDTAGRGLLLKATAAGTGPVQQFPAGWLRSGPGIRKIHLGPSS